MTLAIGSIVAAFFVGAIPFGLVVSHLFFRRDLRDSGSGNIGAANALRSLGKRGAVAVLVLDALKGAAPVFAARALFADPDVATSVAVGGAFAAVAGHCFSPFLRFRGGKGVATHFGAILALAWPAGAAFALVWIAVIIAAGYASLASMLASLALIPVLWYMLGNAGTAYGLATVLLIVFMHRANLVRLRDGTEGTLPLFRSRKGQT